MLELPLAPVIPTSPPTEARAGETWIWTDAYADYPGAAEGWVLSYEIRGSTRITLASSLTVANGEGWTVTVPATTTTDYVAGSYEFMAVLTGASSYAGRVHTVTLPRLTILPNLITAAPGDRIAHCETMLGLVRTAIAARVRGDEPDSYTIDGTSANRIPLKELQAMETRYSQQLRRLRNPGVFGTRVQYRMTVPT